jgi:EAL domain-containing protein (putative c-di-GMP-specific phosphodiesterase class I)/GGDEF domain-containing protein
VHRWPILAYEELKTLLASHLAPLSTSPALLVLNVNDALDVQTQLGLPMSETLFREVPQRIEGALAGRGTFARLGTASYCVLLPGIKNLGHAQLAADKLARAVESALSAYGVATGDKVNVGIALFDGGSTDIDTPLRSAQLAAAAARRRSTRIAAYDEGCADQVLKAGRLARALAEALEAGALTVAYQPKMATTDEHVAGVEALMRWREGNATVATPDEFVPLAEQIGLIQDLTWYSLSNSLRMSADFEQLPVAVNVSPRMLHEREFVEMIESAVRTWGVNPGVLTLELTEGALVADFEQAVRTISSIRSLGVRISIDDFGTGYSSLSYFKRIPADELKIDKSFVLRMLNDPADQRLVGAIISLARQFNLRVVAEGVENRETLKLLTMMGCDCAQGYLYSPALEAPKLREWLTGLSGK